MESWLARLASVAFERPLAALLSVLVITGVSLGLASRLKVDTDLTATLPTSYPAVQALHEMEQRFGGMGAITVVGEGIDPDKIEAFAEDLAPRLAALPDIRYVDYKRPVGFFKEHALYYLATDDLEEIDARIKARVKWERRHRNPMLIDLEESRPPSLDFSDIEERSAGVAGESWIRRMGTLPYYADVQSGLVALMARPTGLASDLDFTKRVVGPVEDLVASLDMSKYGENAHVELTGRFKKRLDQQTEISKDLRMASVVALLLMLAFLGVHFRRLAAIALIMVPLLLGLAWMFGVAGLLFGRLNILTAFVGVILLGLGIDHGIHLLGRFESERARGTARAAAIRLAFGNTGRAVLVAALTTTAAFASLTVSDFLAFREFGTLTAAGTVLIVLSYTVTLPALLAIASRLGFRVSTRPKAESSIARVLPRWAPVIFWVLLLGLAATAFNAREVHFNQDFGALQGSSLPSFQLDDKVNHLLGYSQVPVVIMTDGKAEAEIARAKLEKGRQELGSASSLDFVATVTDLVPRDQDEKHTVLADLSVTLAKIKPGWLEPKVRARFAELKRMASADPFSQSDLPVEITRQFQRPDGTLDDGFVLVFPNADQSHGAQVRTLSKELREDLAGVPGEVYVASESLVLAAVLDIVNQEAPFILSLTCASTFLVTWLLVGSAWVALLCLVPAALTLLVTAGLLPLCGVSLNYLNVVMVPALFGMAIDGAVHIVLRRRDGEALPALMNETGRGIAGSILTTGLGFAALMLADHVGLRSLAELVLVGLAVNLIVCLVGLPALIALLARRAPRTPRGARLAQSVATVGLAGLSPVAPGTMGAIIALPAAWLLRDAQWWVWVVLLGVLAVGSVFVVNRYIELGRTDEDPQEVVLDETVGCLIALAFVPWTAPWVLAAFGLFRLFDIWKPGPIRTVHERLHGGAGVIGDDVLAGLLAGVVLLGVRLVGTIPM